MGSYVGNSKEEQQEMLKESGFSSFEELFSTIPDAVKIKGGLDIPSGKSELEVIRAMKKLAAENHVFPTIFRGAGAYRHYIPAIVRSVTGKEEFLTAYTPYQAEISQGILQAVFEFQTMICELTGMDVSNASVYDGASAAGEAAAMCRERKKKNTVYVSAAADPKVIEVIRTYCFGSGTEVVIVPEKNGVTDAAKLKEMIDGDASCFYVQQPNYFGNIEPASKLGEITHAAGAKYIIGGNPIAMAYIQTPAEAGADIAVGEGQPLGMPLSWGGPYLGFMASTHAMMRKLPGRFVGETVDIEGKRAYVLTLQAREQHIRREKASSNICSNEELCALTASVYMAAMGPDGMQEAASQCTAKAHYLAEELCANGLHMKYEDEFFHEFVTSSSVPAKKILQVLEEADILGGLPLNDTDILWCATEVNTKEEIDKTAALVGEVCEK